MAFIPDPLRLGHGVARIAYAGIRVGVRPRATETALLAHTRLPALPGAPSEALPIVLVHGLCGAQYHWSPAVDALRTFGDIVTLDLPGFGASAQPVRWTLDGACESVTTLLDHLGIDDCLLVGHSLGASVATLLAARNPDRFRGVGLVSPAGFWSQPLERAESRRFAAAFTIWRRGVLLGGGNVVKAPPIRHLAFLAMMHRPLASLTRREAERLVASAAQGRSTIQAREAIVAADLFDDAAALEQPVELVWGRRDRITPFDSAKRLADTIEDVRPRFVDDVGHMVMWEDRGVVVDAVRSLVRRVG